MHTKIDRVKQLVKEQKEEDLRHQNWLERRQPAAVVYPDRDDDVESLSLAKVKEERAA